MQDIAPLQQKYSPCHPASACDRCGTSEPPSTGPISVFLTRRRLLSDYEPGSADRIAKGGRRACEGIFPACCHLPSEGLHTLDRVAK